jgi:hypothetical protein
VTIFVEWVPGVGLTTFVHDYALDGDENLSVGSHVNLTDGIVTSPATVCRRDAAHGWWYFQIDQ